MCSMNVDDEGCGLDAAERNEWRRVYVSLDREGRRAVAGMLLERLALRQRQQREQELRPFWEFPLQHAVLSFTCLALLPFHPLAIFLAPGLGLLLALTWGELRRRFYPRRSRGA